MKLRKLQQYIRFVIISASVTVALFAFASFAPAQSTQARPAFASLSKDAQMLVLSWLNRDCGADDKLVLEDRLKAIDAKLEPVFWEAYRLGPSASSLELDRAHIQKRYKERQAWLAEQGRQLFGKQETERLMTVSLEQYTQKETANIVVGYKTTAILGLGLVGTQGSLIELEHITKDPDNPAAIAAQQAIAAMKARSR
jgi:hypothetical protein